MKLEASYVMPLRWSDDLDRGELADYLRELSTMVAEVIVVDGSDPVNFDRNSAAFSSFVKHLAPDSDLSFANGKVDGVTTGVRAAGWDKVVIGDDDVRYDLNALHRTTRLLDEFDLVRPQNYFDPVPWHAAWDTGRILLNRSLGADFPGTLALRRDLFLGMGGYDGNVMFENLELIRTIEAHGGRTTAPLDLYVRRIPSTAARFLSQRVRQAYDELALPGRLAIWLSVIPVLVWAALRKKPYFATGAYVGIAGLAEIGRRRAGGTRFFPASASLMAPGWVLERGICIWMALAARLSGGVRYGDRKIKKAANPTSALSKGASPNPS